MRAVVYETPGSFQVRDDVQTPTAGPGQVRLKVTQVGVCGTDLHLHHGDFTAAFPLTPGHEVVGLVDQLGDGVTRFAEGQQVTVNPNVYCGRCEFCLAGQLILCENLKGHGSTAPGFFAEYVAVPEQQVFDAAGLDPDVAVFTEPAACAMHGLETVRPFPGCTALVLGAGPTGLLLAQLIATGGAANVTVADPERFKLDRAQRLGIDHLVQIQRDQPELNRAMLLAASQGRGYDLVVEATGATTVGQICVSLTRSGGTVLIYGVTAAAAVMPIHPFEVFRREITIKGSFAEITSFGAALRALHSGRVQTAGIITHRYSLEQYAEALQALAGDPTCHKAVISPVTQPSAVGG